MLHKTRGIALHTVKYSETSIISKIYTEQFGLQSYIIKGIRKQHSKIRPGLFQPLTLLELTVYHKARGSLHTIKELHNYRPYQTITTDILKSSVALFINELVYKSVKEEEANPELFDFLTGTCIKLDETEESLMLIPLLFTIRLSRYLGIIPHVDESPLMTFFNLQEGVFQATNPIGQEFLEPPLSFHFKDLLLTEQKLLHLFQTGLQAHPAVKVRNELLDRMLFYYSIHLPDFREIHAHRVLHSVLA